mgnify:CR=1 FL=1
MLQIISRIILRIKLITNLFIMNHLKIYVKFIIMEDSLVKTYDSNPTVRAKAVRELCPCKLKMDDKEVWKK